MTQVASHHVRLGVDAGENSIRDTFEPFIANDFPGAVVNIVRDPERPGEVFTGHADGDGSKFIQRMLNFREIGNLEIFRGTADDALSTNTGDIAAAGFTSGVITVNDVLNLNAFNVPKQAIMERIGSRLAELIECYRSYGFKMYFLGGKTVNLPHQVQTGIFDVSVHARARESDIVVGNVRSGDRIWGFASGGRAVWEDESNSGIMSNGLTLARVAMMSRHYTEKYPELVRSDGAYEGRFFVDSKIETLGDMSIGQALVSPTRQWAILIKMLLDELKAKGQLHLLHGITMNAGGGATKVLHLGKRGVFYRKQMPSPPVIFQVIQKESRESWFDMYKKFNCGIGLDIVGDEKLAPILEALSKTTNICLYELGKCEFWSGMGNRVELETPFGSFDYL